VDKEEKKNQVCAHVMLPLKTNKQKKDYYLVVTRQAQQRTGQT